ncbi:hypothetical protein X975_03184, partial [Stegodyphus mimosarum]
MRRLCSDKYTKVLRKLVVSDTIRASRDIYVEHLTEERQVPWQFRQNSSQQAPQ